MGFFSWSRWLKGLQGHGSRRGRRASRRLHSAGRGAGLRLETLEERDAPATFTVNAGDVSNVGSGTTGGLVWALNQANSNGEANVINLTNSTYVFTSVYQVSTSGGNDVLPEYTSSHDLTINGNGAVLNGQRVGRLLDFEPTKRAR